MFVFLEIPQAYMTRLVEPFEELTMCVLLALIYEMLVLIDE